MQLKMAWRRQSDLGPRMEILKTRDRSKDRSFLIPSSSRGLLFSSYYFPMLDSCLSKTARFIHPDPYIEASMTARILIVDDRAVVRDQLRTVLELIGEITVVGEAAGGREAICQAEALKPDIVLMDLEMP